MQPNVAEEIEGKLINVEPDTPASVLIQEIKQKRKNLQANRNKSLPEPIEDSVSQGSLEMNKKRQKFCVFVFVCLFVIGDQKILV